MSVIDYILFVMSGILYVIVLLVTLVSIYIALSIFTPPPKTGINREVDRWMDRVSEWHKEEKNGGKKHERS